MAPRKHQNLLTPFFLLLFTSTLVNSLENGNTIQHNQTSTPIRLRKHRNQSIIADQRAFIIEHNNVRKQLGEPPLVWDRELAKYARRFAATRVNDCKMIHSGTDIQYGENIYWGSVYEKHTAAEAVQKWAAETLFYDKKTNKCIENKDCGHYKQIVWRRSTRFGCARQKCLSGGVYIICDYDPPGNWENESPFDIPSSQTLPSFSTSLAAASTSVPAPPSPPSSTLLRKFATDYI